MPKISRSVLLLALVLPLALHASSGTPAQLAELTPSDPTQYADFGTSIAGSGNTVVVGAPSYYEGANPGAAYVFVKPSSGWQDMTETAKLTPSDGVSSELFGQAVAMNGDTIVVGCGNGTEVYVFAKPAGGWRDMTETAKLTSSDNGVSDVFGGSVSIDGGTIVAGALNGNQGNGAAFVYVEPSGGWIDMTQTAELTSSNGHLGYFGYSVAIAGDTIVVGAENQPGGLHVGEGAAYVFVKPAGGWADATQNAELVASDREFGSQFGFNVAVAASTIVVGAPLAHGKEKGPGRGASYIFTKPSKGRKILTETAQLSWGSTFNEDFGISNSVSGNAIAVGVPRIQVGSVAGQGAAAIFLDSSGGWQSSSQPRYGLTSPGALEFGRAIAISGKTLLVGADGTSSGRMESVGSAYVFGLE